MRKYLKEIIVVLIQVFMFYIIPLFAGPTDAMGMVFILIITSFILSFIIGIISKEKIKYLYPIIISILFIPSIFIYYNKTALIHTVWYFVDVLLGEMFGIIIKRIVNIK